MNAWADADGHWRALVNCVSDAYRAVDSYAARFASSKLKRDPVFRHVFEHGLIPPGATVLDLGCGQGLLAGCVAAAADAQRRRPLAQSRILLVDDNVDFADSLKLLLTYEGHVVEVCNDGKSAVEVAKRMAPDVVLLDFGLPGMNGFETARAMRALPELRDALLIAVSGYAQDEDRRRSAREGFNAHLKKPVDLKEILEIMQGN